MATPAPPLKCPKPMKATSNGVFQGDDPLDYALPLAIVQICLVLVLTRVLAYLLRPLRQPRVVAEIIVSVSCFWLSFFLFLMHSITFGSMCMETFLNRMICVIFQL